MRRTYPVLLVLILACEAADRPSDAAESAFSAQDESAVRALSRAHGRAWVAGDTAAVMALFAPDAVLIPHLGNPPVVKRSRSTSFPLEGHRRP